MNKQEHQAVREEMYRIARIERSRYGGDGVMADDFRYATEQEYRQDTNRRITTACENLGIADRAAWHIAEDIRRDEEMDAAVEAMQSMT